MHTIRARIFSVPRVWSYDVLFQNFEIREARRFYYYKHESAHGDTYEGNQRKLFLQRESRSELVRT